VSSSETAERVPGFFADVQTLCLDLLFDLLVCQSSLSSAEKGFVTDSAFVAIVTNKSCKGFYGGHVVISKASVLYTPKAERAAEPKPKPCCDAICRI